jgi:fucose 4-O-acetylase-like acetyltransferase
MKENNRQIDDTLSKRIHSLRFLLIVLVVFIHNTVIDIGVNFSDGTQTFAVPLYVAKTKKLAETFTGIAVPLFFLLSGFLLYMKAPKYVENLKRKCRTILMPYILWIILVLIFLYAAQSFNFTKPYFANVIIRDFKPIDFIDAFIGKFTAAREYRYPLVFQFWFLRDLFILNLLFTVIRKIVDSCPGGAFILFLMLWISNINIYVVNAGALFFFTLGYYIVKYNMDYKHLDNIKTFDIIIMYMMTITALLSFKEKAVPIIAPVNTIVGIVFFIKLSRYFVRKSKIYSVLAWLEQYAFWVYAAHGIAIAVMIKLSVKIMPMDGGWLLAHYFIVTLLCIFVLTGIGILFRKIFPKIFLILTGGR